MALRIGKKFPCVRMKKNLLKKKQEKKTFLYFLNACATQKKLWTKLILSTLKRKDLTLLLLYFISGARMSCIRKRRSAGRFLRGLTQVLNAIKVGFNDIFTHSSWKKVTKFHKDLIFSFENFKRYSVEAIK